MSGLLGRINRLLGRRQSQRSFVACDLGFHDDAYLLDLVDRRVSKVAMSSSTMPTMGRFAASTTSGARLLPVGDTPCATPTTRSTRHRTIR